MLMILFQIAQAVVIKKFNTFVSPKKKVFFSDWRKLGIVVVSSGPI